MIYMEESEERKANIRANTNENERVGRKYHGQNANTKKMIKNKMKESRVGKWQMAESTRGQTNGEQRRSTGNWPCSSLLYHARAGLGQKRTDRPTDRPTYSRTSTRTRDC